MSFTINCSGRLRRSSRDKKHLMIIGSGPLTALPFQVLVKAKPDSTLTGDEKYRKADWLIRHHAITTLPSVASLKALRGLSGKAKTGRTAAYRLCRSRVQPALPTASNLSSWPVRPSPTASITRGYASFFKGRNADLGTLAAFLPPLPGTRLEMTQIAKVLKVSAEQYQAGPRCQRAGRQSRQTRSIPYRLFRHARA